MGQVDIKYSFQYSRAFKNSSPRSRYHQTCVCLDTKVRRPVPCTWDGRHGGLAPPTHLVQDSQWQHHVRPGSQFLPSQGLRDEALTCFWGSQVTGDSMTVCLPNKGTIQLPWLRKIKENAGALPFREIRNQLWPFESKKIFLLHLYISL